MNNLVMTIKIEAPELSEAINRLSAALLEGKALSGLFAAHMAKNQASAVPQTPGPVPAITAAVTPPVAPQPPMTAPAVPVTPAAPMAGQTSAYPSNPAPQTAAPGPVMPGSVTPVAGVPATPIAPTTPTPGYTVEQLSKAGAALTSIDPGKRDQLIALLQQFGVQAITQLAPEHYGAFATALRGLGAAI